MNTRERSEIYGFRKCFYIISFNLGEINCSEFDGRKEKGSKFY